MGRIKTKLVKRVARELVEKINGSFNKEFNSNKKSLGQSMPSKRIRNMIAGYVTRLKRQETKLIKD